TIGPQTKCATSWDWDCDYSSHRRPFAITRPIKDRLRLLAPSRPFVRRKITVATRQRRYRSGSPCPRKASAQSDPRRRLYLLFINKLSLVLSLCIKRESFIHLGCRGDY